MAITKKQTFQVNFTGGIISLGILLSLLKEAQAARVTQVQFGLRQQIFLDVPETMASSFEQGCAARNIICRTKKEAAPNIVSSYPAAGLFTTDTWLREDVLKDIFNQFENAPQFKVNICDRTQSLVPLFTGHVNWVSSSLPHFWHLYLRVPKSQVMIQLPHLVYTNEIGILTKKIESALLDWAAVPHKDSNDVQDFLVSKIQAATENSTNNNWQNLQLPKFSLPYYEGFNQSDRGTWLGIYRRDQLFSVPFLMDVCMLCNESKIGELYATPWKSLIIKGIAKNDREKWDHVLGKYRINVRHAANELAWQVEDGDEHGLLIKRTVIRHFDKEDVRTYGLSFGVQTKQAASMFGSIIIRKKEVKNPHRLSSLNRYDLLHTADFNPNASQLFPFREGLEKEQLGVYIVSLCKMFYQQEAEKFAQKTAATQQTQKEPKHIAAPKEKVYQCRHCLTVYDPILGDIASGIKGGTAFNQLPDDYECALCESPKEDFVLKQEASLQPELS